MSDAPVTLDSTSHIQRLRQRGTDELADQFDAARSELHRLVSLRLSSQLAGRVDASDVIQDAFVEANRRLPEFLVEPKVSPVTWFRQITRQTLAVVYRRHIGTAGRDANREQSLLSPAPGADSIVVDIEESIASPHSAIARAELTQELLSIIGSMNSSDREVLTLKALEQKSFAAVAAELDIGVEAAMKRFQRAILRLGKLAGHLNETSG